MAVYKRHVSASEFLSPNSMVICSVTRDGVSIGHWTFELLQVLATINFNRFTNSATLQLPMALAKSSTSLLRLCYATASNKGTPPPEDDCLRLGDY
jgi:hypothetical protein